MQLTTACRIFGRLAQARRHEKFTRPQLERHQAASLDRLRHYAYARSPFYRRFHAGLTDRPLAELPVLTKALMMENFDELVTDPAIRLHDLEVHLSRTAGIDPFLDRYVVNVSSGSSGRRGFFVFSPAEWASLLATWTRIPGGLPLRAGVPLRTRRATIASKTLWHQSAQVSHAFASGLTPILRLDASESIASMVEKLNAWQPTVMAVYSSVAGLLAEEQLAGRLRISLRALQVGVEVLSSATRGRIEQAWGPNVYEGYGATESGVIGAECSRHLGMHLFEDQTIIEVVDGAGRPVPAGMYGEKVLLTVLFRKTQPLIRYELSDMVRLAAHDCPCGLPFRLIDSVQGRADEVLRFPCRSGGEVAVHPIVFRRVLNSVHSTGWQLTQEADCLKVLFSGLPNDLPDERITGALSKDLLAQGAIVPRILLLRVPTIERGATGKTPLIRALGQHKAAAG